MNRRSFISALALVPFLGLARRLPAEARPLRPIELWSHARFDYHAFGSPDFVQQTRRLGLKDWEMGEPLRTCAHVLCEDGQFRFLELPQSIADRQRWLDAKPV